MPASSLMLTCSRSHAFATRLIASNYSRVCRCHSAPCGARQRVALFAGHCSTGPVRQWRCEAAGSPEKTGSRKAPQKYVAPTWQERIGHVLLGEAERGAQEGSGRGNGAANGASISAETSHSSPGVRPRDAAAGEPQEQSTNGASRDGTVATSDGDLKQPLLWTASSSMPAGTPPTEAPNGSLDSHLAASPKVQPETADLATQNGAAAAASKAAEPDKEANTTVPAAGGTQKAPSHVGGGLVQETPSQSAGGQLEQGPSQTATSTVTYILRLSTSRIPGSGIADRNGGVQVAIIGQSGQAISARVYASLGSQAETAESEREAELAPAGMPSASSTVEESGAPERSRGSEEASTQLKKGQKSQGALGWSKGPLQPSQGLEAINAVISSTGEGAFSKGGQAVVCVRATDVRPVAALWVAPLSDTWRVAEAYLGVVSRDELASSRPTSRARLDAEVMPAGAKARAEEEEEDDGWDIPEDDGEDEFFEFLESELRASSDSERGDGSGKAEEAGGSFMDLAASSKLEVEGVVGPTTSLNVGTLYVFRPDEDEVLGSSGDALAVELRPLAIRSLEKPSLLKLLEGSSFLSQADASLDAALELAQADALRRQLAQLEGMEEYRKLKEWLLLSTSALVAVGTLAAAQIGGDGVGAAFAAGGLASLLFLLNLQRGVDSIGRNGDSTEVLGSVDPMAWKSDGARTEAAVAFMESDTTVLSAVDRETAAALKGQPQSQSQPESPLKVFLGRVQLNGPLLLRVLTVGLCFGAVALLLGQAQGGNSTGALGGFLGQVQGGSSGGALGGGSPPVLGLQKLEPEQVVAGILGFLTHKISVVLAAFRRSGK